jgi:peptidoglycan/LPS O-acetylase OafA/YrhL
VFTSVAGLSDERIWNSFFLQYLWEFVLGMWLAKVYYEHPEKIKIPSLTVLCIAALCGMALTGAAGFAGGIWKSFNDIPSLVGYMSLALIVYKIGFGWVNNFFEYTNQVSYEWYLTHILVFEIYFRYMLGLMPCYVDWGILMVASYVVAIGYNKIMKRITK